MDSYTGAVIVIPTRNRAELAERAIRSALAQEGGDDFRILVSDNSTLEEEAERLAHFCERIPDARLRYVRPPKPLTMTPHWEWVAGEALRLYDASHVTFLTDRMIFKPGALKSLLDIAALYPDKIVSYHHDRIVDHTKPIRLEQYDWTGNLYEVEALHLSYLYSQSMPHPCLPRMLNCVAPRSVIETVKGRFGSIFNSVSPDYNFGFRCLEVLDSFLFYDKSLILGYALDRSNGMSMSRGVMTNDHADFMANLVEKSFCFAAPMPEIATVGNAVFHEYCVVRQETASERFFDIDRAKYLAYLAREVDEIENQQVRSEMQARLAARGWAREAAAARQTSSPKTRSLARRLLSPRTALFKLRRLSGHPRAKRAWLFLSRRFGVRPPDDHRFEFDDVEEAFDFMRKFPRAPLAEWTWQEEMLGVAGRTLESAAARRD